MAQIACRHFSGYKPCGLNDLCNETCPKLDKPRVRILLIHLEALGAVLRTTSLLPAIKRKFASSHITWVTKPAAAELLKHNPYIDRVLTTSIEDILALGVLEFDIAYCVDKSLQAAGLLRVTRAEKIYGFIADPYTGAIIPGTEAARELWELGLNDQKKFFENQKPETQLLAEALELPYRRDSYVCVLNEPERIQAAKFRAAWGPVVIGLNTGCSPTIAAKKLSIEAHRELVSRLAPFGRVVLLGGGREDAERNRCIGEGLDVIQANCEDGLRAGLVSMAACDIVVSGDSLGLHMAIALGKYTVAWFGPTCVQEIDLFDRGAKIRTQAPCSPCWKRSCSKTVMCYDLVSLNEIVSHVKDQLWRISLSKPHSSETSSSPSL